MPGSRIKTYQHTDIHPFPVPSLFENRPTSTCACWIICDYVAYLDDPICAGFPCHFIEFSSKRLRCSCKLDPQYVSNLLGEIVLVHEFPWTYAGSVHVVPGGGGCPYTMIAFQSMHLYDNQTDDTIIPCKIGAFSQPCSFDYGLPCGPAVGPCPFNDIYALPEYASLPTQCKII